MFNRILVTEGGPHPAADWARVTVEDLIPLQGMDASVQTAGMILRGRLIEVLTDHYQRAQDDERAALQHSPERFDAELKDVKDFGQVFSEIQAAATGTPWQDHITGREVIDAVRQVITQHAQHLRHVERLCHADQHPEHDEGQAYRARNGLPASPQTS